MTENDNLKIMPEAKSQGFRWDFAAAAVAAAAGIFHAWYVHAINLTKILVDENAHLNVTRQVVDGLTPGISQIGFWPPLLHIIMVPFVSVDWLYHSGLAGAAALIPFLSLSAWFVFRLSSHFTKNKLLSFAAALVFIFNPYILYYSTVPMMEILFITALLATAYFFVKWSATGKLRYLILCGLATALCGTSRFEGLIVILIIPLLIAAAMRKKSSWGQIEAAVILFLFVAVLGALAILSYGWVYGNNPLAFMNSEWSAFSQQRDYVLPTQNNFLTSARYLLHSSYYMIGRGQVVIAAVSIAALALVFGSVPLTGALIILLSPFIFDLISLFRGNILIYVWELPPYNWFYNERYGLYSAAAAVLAPILLSGFILNKFKSSTARNGLAAFAGISLVFFQVFYWWQVAISGSYAVVRAAAYRYPAWTQYEVAAALGKYYDGGKILITRALHDEVTVEAGLPLKDYIHESNFKFYNQALERPWLFARWVVMYNNSTDKPHMIEIPSWSLKNEKVSARWGNSPVFNRYYELVFENDVERVYKINEGAVRSYAARLGLTMDQVPSLNKSIAHWDPDRIYNAMNAEALQYIPEETQLTRTP